ncbi:hypothetical protein Sjap_006793 [Stephania japonica]|uniref:Uncharacterized protein n=1 Tax=Stephania japonica TaxID=461633 RepID=A0AAP0PMA5_9MAGN
MLPSFPQSRASAYCARIHNQFNTNHTIKNKKKNKKKRTNEWRAEDQIIVV